MCKNPVLQIRNLNVGFKTGSSQTPVLRGLSYDLPSGRVLAIVGESGSGKTVHALSILRLLPAVACISEGEILYKGKNLLTLSARDLRQIRGQHISMIFQDPSASLNPVLTIGEQLSETLRVHCKLTQEQAKTEVITLLKKVGIAQAEKRMNEYPFQFSGGMCQRVMIAMALALSPDVLIADEPTTALDVTIQAQIIHLIKELQQKNKTAVIFITHNLALASQVADDILVLYSGLCMEQAPATELFTRPLHPYTQGLLASLPTVNTRLERLEAIAGQPPVVGEEIVGCPFAPRCPYAMDQCRNALPPLREVGARRVRCFREDPK